MDSQRLEKFEIFGLGCFTAITFLDIDNLLGFQVPVAAKIVAALIILVGWVVYIFKGVGEVSTVPSHIASKQVAENRKKILFILGIFATIGALVIFLFARS